MIGGFDHIVTYLYVIVAMLLPLLVFSFVRKTRCEKQRPLDVQDGYCRFNYSRTGVRDSFVNVAENVDEPFQTGAIEDWNRVGKNFGRKRNAKKLRDQKHIVLFLGAESNPKKTIHVDDDCDAIKSVLEGSDIFHVVERYDVKKVDIVPLITQFKPSVVHFDGHGTPEGKIAVCSDVGKFDLISPEEFRCLFNAVKSYVKLCYFDVCHTSSHAQQAVLSVGSAIGMGGEWPVEAARVFSRQFYHALENEHPIGQAFELARSQLVMSGQEKSSAIPRLELSVGSEAEVYRFVAKTSRKGLV